MEHGLQISVKGYALSMEDKMAAGTFGRVTNDSSSSSVVEVSDVIQRCSRVSLLFAFS